MYNNKRITVIIPVIVVVSIIVGMFLNGFFFGKDNRRDANFDSLPFSGFKTDLILKMIDNFYVDTVDIRRVEEKTIFYLLGELDPHSSYIPLREMKKVNEELSGEFGGVGVQFYRYQDTVVVVNVIPGGPAEAAGLFSGDRIVYVNDSLIVGEEWDNDRVMGTLRGGLGTKVDLGIYRKNHNKLLRKKIVRGNIPIHSVDIAYMINDTTGYIRIASFGLKTYDEFMEGMENFADAKKLIVDLRGNPGGVLPVAVNMINEFLEEGRSIVYTQGKAVQRTDFTSNGKGRFQNLPLVVLIDESSASASEIFAGAVQDNDRGVIIGRRSFGKGLVQEQRMLFDGSALRLTVSRYYTPAGRSIQKPYDKGNEAYFGELYKRLMHGEMNEKDSIHFDSQKKFYTLKGRQVYGGGGIMPDIFVPADTSGYSTYLAKAVRKNLVYEFSFDFMDRHREETREIRDYKQLLEYLSAFDIVGEMTDYAARRGLEPDRAGIKESYDLIHNLIEVFIGQHVLGNAGAIPIRAKEDKTIKKALEINVARELLVGESGV